MNTDVNKLIENTTMNDLLEKMTNLFINLLLIVQNFIKPITTLGITIAVLLLLIGFIFHVQTAKKMGTSILSGVVFTFIIYLLAPYILGALYNSIK